MAIRYQKKVYKKKNRRKYLVFVLIFVTAFLGYKFFYKKDKISETVTNVSKAVEKVEVVKPKDPQKSQEEIQVFLGAQMPYYAYSVYDLKTGKSFGWQEDKVYKAASSIKIIFAAYIYNLAEKGETSLDKKITYTQADYEEGTGVLIARSFGTALTVREYIKLMIEKSDNAATNVLTRTYSPAKIQNWIGAQGITGVDIKNNKITPRALATFFVKLYRDSLGMNSYKEELIGYLKNSLISERIKGELPETVAVAHKIGTQTDSISDSGIVFASDRPYVVSIFTNKYASIENANANIARISKIIYDYFGE